MKRLMTILLMTLAGAAQANSGLRTTFGEVIVRGLKIGQTYSMHKMLNLPLRIVNTSDQEVELLCDVILAQGDGVKRGYEVASSTSWVRLEQTRFQVGPNREAVTDVIVSIPNDTALLGRRFQIDIWSRTRSTRGTYAVGIQSRLLVHVDSTPPTEDELKKPFVQEQLTNLDFTVLPMVATVLEVPLGREVDLRRELKTSIKLVNPNDKALNFRIRSIPNWESLLNVPAGFEDAYNPQWLRPEKEVVKVEGNSIADTGLYLNIPDTEQNRGRSFFFSVGIEVLEQKIPTRVFYKLLATTPAGKPAANP